MMGELHFVRVINALFEPNLQLRVTARVPSGAPSSFEISIEHDPEISSDKLTMPTPDWLVRMWQRANSTPAPPEVPFDSGQSRSIAQLFGNVLLGESEARFVLWNSALAIAGMSERLEASVGHRLERDGAELLEAILRAAIELPFWDEQARLQSADPGGGAKIRNLALYMATPGTADPAVIEASSSESAVSNEVLLAAREVRQ